MLVPYSAFIFTGGNLTGIDWSKAILGNRQGPGCALRLDNRADGRQRNVVRGLGLRRRHTGTFSWQVAAAASVFVPTALETLSYTYDADSNVKTVTDSSTMVSRAGFGDNVLQL